MSCLVSTLLYEFLVSYFIPYSSFFGPSLASADNIPNHPSCTVQYFFFFLPPNPSFCCPMLVVSWSLLVLLSPLFVYDCQCSSNRMGDYEKDLGR
jgi:hypothetical protein